MGLKTVCNCGVLSILCSSYRYLERSEIEGERGKEKGGKLKEERCRGEREKKREKKEKGRGGRPRGRGGRRRWGRRRRFGVCVDSVSVCYITDSTEFSFQ